MLERTCADGTGVSLYFLDLLTVDKCTCADRAAQEGTGVKMAPSALPTAARYSALFPLYVGG